MPTKIVSDRLKQHKQEMDKMMDYIQGSPEYVPVDAFGARTDYTKGEDNLQKAGQDVRERFDMNLPSTREDLKGGQ